MVTESRCPVPLEQITARFAEVFGEITAIIALLTSDSWLTMQPLPFV